MTTSLLIAVGLLAAGAPQRPAATSGAADLVRIGATLETTSGVPVLEIDCAKFEIHAGGKVLPLAGCERALPVTIALLFDASSSFSYEMSIRSLVSEISPALRPDDRLGIGWFASSIVAPARFTNERRTLDADAARAAEAADEPTGPSPLWDAVAAAVEALSTASGRRALIVVTDGRATGNQTPFPVTARQLVMSGVELHVIGRTFAGRASGIPPAYQDLVNRPAMLALASGGTATGAGMGFQAVKPQLRAILAGLQRSYTLAFAPDAREGIHPLEVRVHVPGVVVRAADRFGVR